MPSTSVNPVLRSVARALPPSLRDRLRRTVRRGQNERPVIGIAGFFGAGNYGDELFLEVYKQYFGEEFELRVLADLPKKPFYSRPVEEIVKEVDAIVIGGGDILQSWNSDPRYFNQAFLKKPVFVVGIGVPQYKNAKPVSESAMRKHTTFLQHPSVKRIGVRDDQAAQWIRKNIEPKREVLVAPDMVCSLNLPEAQKPDGAPILGIATRQRPNLAEPDDYTRIEELARHATEQGWRIRHIILGTMEVGRRDVANAEDLDVPGKELVYVEDLDELSRSIGECTAFASMKFHGTVVATMYGVPSIVMIATNKNVNFMRRIGLDGNLSSFTDPNLVSKFEERTTPTPEDLERIRKDTDQHMQDLVNHVRLAVRATANA